MEKVFNVLENSPLFEGISKDEMELLFGCLDLQTKSFTRKELVVTEGDAVNWIGLVLSGKVIIQQENFWGHTDILAKVESGDIFAEAYVCGRQASLPVTVEAEEETEILLLDYQQTIDWCSKACTFHNRFIQNLLQIISEKNIRLLQKISVLNKRTTREKVLSYLSFEARKQHAPSFEINFNRQELADYLSVDRSALSKELSRMQQAGLIRYHKSRFELLAHE